MTVIVTLPWYDPRLTPNAKRRRHWRSYQPVIRDARAMAWGLTLEQTTPEQRKAIADTEGKICVTVTFHPPDRRRRDDDGAISACKHARDGICDALGIDDNRWQTSYRMADPEKPGRVIFEIGE